MSTYGKACLQCTRAKVRCAYAGSEQLVCERCARLKKECRPAPRSRAKNPRSRVDKHSALEAKVDGIVEILKRTQNIPSEQPTRLESTISPATSTRPQRCGPALAATPLYQLSIQAGNQERVPLPTAHDVGHVSSSQQRDASPPLYHPGRPRDGIPIQGAFGKLLNAASNAIEDTNLGSSKAGGSVSSRSTSQHYSTPASSVADVHGESTEELQDVLDTYRNIMCEFSPVVLLPPDATVEYMATERPYLWLVIRMICTKKLARQLILAEEILRTIAQKILIEGERSFDMLCALIVYINWGQFSCVKANLSPPIHLAFALAADLGLTKPAPQCSPAVMMNFTQAGCPKPPHALVVKKRTMEERRIVLGLFYISSISANFFQRTEPLRWTPYLESCLNLLMESKEEPNDELLAFLVRIQIIANSLQTDSHAESCPETKDSRPPRMQMIQLQKLQLDDLKRTIPPRLKDNPIVHYHILGAELSLYEQYLQPSTATLSPVEQNKHIEGLWQCFRTVKEYTKQFFNTETGPIPLASYLYLSISSYTHLGHCLVALFRLSTFEAPNIPWDKRYIVSQLDLGTVVRQWLHVMESSPRATGIDVTGANGQDSQWEYSRKILQPTILKWWETKVRPSIMGEETDGQDQQHVQMQNAGATVADANVFEAAMPDLDFGDIDFAFDTETWMRDMFNSGFDFKSF